MILSYLNLVGSASAKELFSHCVGTLIKREEMRHQSKVGEVITHNNKGGNAPGCYEYRDLPASIDPVEFRIAITNDLICELESLVASKLITQSTNAVGQVFYRRSE